MERNTTTAAHGADMDPVRWAIQPKELKFDVFLTGTNGKLTETAVRGGEGVPRRGFRPAPRLHALTPGKTIKLADTAAIDESLLQRTAKKRGGEPRAGRLTLVYPHLMLEERPTSARHRSREPRPTQDGVVVAAAAAIPTNDARRGGAAARTAVGRVAPRPRPLAPLSARSALDLHVEGNSVLGADVALAGQALSHLTECVAAERALRERLEAARYATLQAFRAVNKISTGVVYVEGGGGASETHTGGMPRTFGDTLALARCSVVTSTLVCTIQSYLRSYHARQLTFALQRLRRKLGRRAWADCCGSTLSVKSDGGGSGGDGAGGADAASSRSGTASRALEELLDMQEISRLRQLYFDYYDCEVVSLDSPEWSASCDMVSGRTLFGSSSDRDSALTASERVAPLSNVASTTM